MIVHPEEIINSVAEAAGSSVGPLSVAGVLVIALTLFSFMAIAGVLFPVTLVIGAIAAIVAGIIAYIGPRSLVGDF